MVHETLTKATITACQQLPCSKKTAHELLPVLHTRRPTVAFAVNNQPQSPGIIAETGCRPTNLLGACPNTSQVQRGVHLQLICRSVPSTHNACRRAKYSSLCISHLSCCRGGGAETSGKAGPQVWGHVIEQSNSGSCKLALHGLLSCRHHLGDLQPQY